MSNKRTRLQTVAVPTLGLAEDGQATAEYALVMLAAAGLAGMVLAWAVGGNGVERLMNAVLDSIIAEVTG